MSCPRDPSQITQLSPEGLASHRSMGINGNYFTREKDEWAAGRETSPFVVSPSVSHSSRARLQTRARSYKYTHAQQEEFRLNNRWPVKQFFSLARVHASVREHNER